jgi:hypothetical protein
MSKGTEEMTELTEDELEREAQSPYISRTLRRIWLTIGDPFRAMRYIAYSPDWGIVLFVMGLLTGLSYLQYYLIFRYKMVIPSNFLSTEIDGVRNFIVNWYFSGAFVATGLSILIGLAIMVLLTRALSGTLTVKQTSIGVFYANIGRTLVTAIIVLAIVASPPVVTPIDISGRGPASMVIDTPAGKMNVTMTLTFNYTVPINASTVQLPDVQSSMVEGPTNLTVMMSYNASINGRPIIFWTVNQTGQLINSTSQSINYSSIEGNGRKPLQGLDQGVATGFDVTIPEESLAPYGIKVEAHYVLPLYLTYMIPGADNSSMPTWASWVYDPTSRQNIMVFKVPLNATFAITDGNGRTADIMRSTNVLFDVSHVPEGQYFSKRFFTGWVPTLFSGMGYFALIWQALLFAVVARVIDELSWPKAVACTAAYLVITLVLGTL